MECAIRTRQSSVIPTAKACHPGGTNLSSRPQNSVIPTAVEGSQPVGSKLATWHCQVPPEGDPSAALRMTEYGVARDRKFCHPDLDKACHPGRQICHPDRSGGISASWQQTAAWH